MSVSERPVAISGLGSIGIQHARAFAALDIPVIGFDPDTELRASATTSSAVVDTCASFAELVARRPRAVVIAAPDRFHLEQLDESTAAGIPTLVEKPLAPSLPAARAAVPAIAARRVPVLMGYVLRHRRILQVVRDLIGRDVLGAPVGFQVMLGAFGTITAARSRFAEPEPDRLFRDYSHEWDYLSWLFGPLHDVVAVARTIDVVAHVERPNVVDALLRTRVGVTGAVHLDYVEPRGTRTLHIVGTAGSLFADLRRGTGWLMADSDSEFSHPEAAIDALTTQARHMLAVADGASEPLVGLTDGLAALAVTEAAIRAAGSGRWEPVPAVDECGTGAADGP